MTPKTLVVKREADGAVLLDFLARRLGSSKKQAKSLLDARAVLVNRRRVWMARHVLRAGDRVEIAGRAPRVAGESLFHILYEDPDYLVADKPAGILSNGPLSLEERLRQRMNLPELRAVHRLDRDTTGCLLFAKDTGAFDRMLPLFREHRVHKTYHAVVTGRLQPARQTLKSPLEGRTAVTRVRSLASNSRASHLLVRIDTGRTHQIRRHLAAHGHPVAGDRRYAGSRSLSAEDIIPPRQMLHASALAFTHPATGRRVSARSALPTDFRRCLRLFRLAGTIHQEQGG